MKVPESYLGVWQRTLLKAADGEDTESAVFWLQTRHLHGDIRLPGGSSALTRLSGFVGITTVEAERCQWHRLLDSHPSGGADIGLMQFETREKLIERALDDSYLEVWERLPDSIGPQQAFWFNGPEQRRACLLIAGDYFFYGQARLLEAAKPADPSQFCFGRIQGSTFPWHITHSTDPSRIGHALLSQLPLNQAAFDQLHLSAASGWSLGIWPALPAALQETCS